MNEIDRILGVAEVQRITPDIYLRLADATQRAGTKHARSIYYANHFDVSNAFPMALDDLEALREASLLGLECADLPRIASDYKFAKAGYHIDDIDAWFANRKGLALRAAIEANADHAITALKNTPGWLVMTDQEQAIELRLLKPSVAQLMEGNLSQSIRNLQEKTFDKTWTIFKRFYSELSQYSERAGWTFGLRVPLAMQTASRATLLASSPLSGIPVPESYLSPTMLELMDRLLDSGMTDIFTTPQKVTDDSIGTALKNRRDFLYWDNLTAWALASHESNQVAVTPTCLPPWLLTSSEQTVPVYWKESVPLGSYTEQLSVASFYAPGLLESSPEVITQVEPALDSVFMGHCLSILCIGVSLLATQIRLGRGHTRPAWTATPINGPLLRWYMGHLTHHTAMLVAQNKK